MKRILLCLGVIMLLLAFFLSSNFHAAVSEHQGGPQSMQMEQPKPCEIRLQLTDQPTDAKKPRLLGIFVIDCQGMVRAEAAEPYLTDFLNHVATSINREEFVPVPDAPRPGMNPHANVSRLVKRSDPDFVNAVIMYLKWSHGIAAEKIANFP